MANAAEIYKASPQAADEVIQPKKLPYPRTSNTAPSAVNQEIGKLA